MYKGNCQKIVWQNIDSFLTTNCIPNLLLKNNILKKYIFDDFNTFKSFTDCSDQKIYMKYATDIHQIVQEKYIYLTYKKTLVNVHYLSEKMTYQNKNNYILRNSCPKISDNR